MPSLSHTLPTLFLTLPYTHQRPEPVKENTRDNIAEVIAGSDGEPGGGGLSRRVALPVRQRRAGGETQRDTGHPERRGGGPGEMQRDVVRVGGNVDE